ncbi:MAG: imidazole glycerol phosphate synthase subunit HisH [Actinomycetota bacterium]
MKAGIIDYRMGNLASVSKALEAAGADYVISERPQELAEADLLVLPGVGNFAAGMANLSSCGLDEFTRQWARSGRPLLGICMGMQLLFDESDEGPAAGLGILPGRVERFEVDLKVPHMGWNTLTPVGDSPVFEDFAGHYFYFVHSFYCRPAGRFIGATTDYGVEFCSAVHAGNVVGVQFHPEKSSDDGLALYRRLLKELSA